MLEFSKIARSIHTDKYRPDIDGLRAIAVAAVVICHAFPTRFPGGFVGVDIFFVISGYLISSILISDLDKGNFSILKFYDRRIRRIFPALITVLLVTFAIGWLILLRNEFRSLGAHITASTLFFENFKLWGESGYFDTNSINKPLLHLWSLAIEEQFYVFWPLLMLVAHRGHIKFIAMFAVLGTLSFAINLYDIHSDPVGAYYSPLGRFWELMIGACLAYLQSRHLHILSRFQTVQSVLGTLFIMSSFVLMNPERNFPGFWALLPTAGSFLLISASSKGLINRTILSNRPLVWLGLISYPLYLWHWPMLSFAHISLGLVKGLNALSIVAVATLTALFTFLFIERHFRTPSTGPTKTLSLTIAMLAVCICGAFAMTGTLLPRLYRFKAPTHGYWDYLLTKHRITTARL